MLRRLATGAMVLVSVLAMSVPASAAPGTRKAKFTERSSATLEYSNKKGWVAKVSASGRDLPPGEYLFVVIKASGPPGEETGGRTGWPGARWSSPTKLTSSS